MRLWDTDLLFILMLMTFIAFMTVTLNNLNEIKKNIARIEQHVQDALQVISTDRKAVE